MLSSIFFLSFFFKPKQDMLSIAHAIVIMAYVIQEPKSFQRYLQPGHLGWKQNAT